MQDDIYLQVKMTYMIVMRFHAVLHTFFSVHVHLKESNRIGNKKLNYHNIYSICLSYIRLNK